MQFGDFMNLAHNVKLITYTCRYGRGNIRTQPNFKIEGQTLGQLGDFRRYTKLYEINKGNHAHNVGHDIKHKKT